MTVPFKEGDIIRHFKRDIVTSEERQKNMYLYKVLAVGMHTETKERMLVYQALYFPFGVFVRPLEMATEVVRGKAEYAMYGDMIQEHRLELCDDKEYDNYPNVIKQEV